MTQFPFENAAALRIGAVQYVAPDELKVTLDIETPSSVALNTGLPRPFPRVNGYVLISADSNYLVGQIEWITIEPAPYPKRKGMSDFGIIDLPYPIRKMKIAPLGTLSQDMKATQPNKESTLGHSQNNQEYDYTFTRGVKVFPSVGADVLLPTDEQLKAIVQSGEHRRIKIGTCPLADNADVNVDPDRLFGRHLAILGNTGSGKSCSVAGLIKWSLREASTENEKNKKPLKPNARFIVLDPNGEYARAFERESKSGMCVKIFSTAVDEECLELRKEYLRVPMWFWNNEEWCAFTQASAKTQKPVLIDALRGVKNAATKIEDKVTIAQQARQTLLPYLAFIEESERNRAYIFSYPGKMNFGSVAKAFNAELLEFSKNADNSLKEEQITDVKSLSDYASFIVKRDAGKDGYLEAEVRKMSTLARKAYKSLGGDEDIIFSTNDDAPKHFRGKDLLTMVENLAHREGVRYENISTLITRIRSILSNTRMCSIIDNYNKPLEDWLTAYIGSGQENKDNIPSVTIIDLSLVPTEIIHIVIAVTARMTLEALQRHHKQDKGKSLPTVLVMEEAHAFIKRYKEDAEDQNAAAICCQVFEKIAREGRKFGLGLVVSSQRPSELSPTVLSQCNSFLIHRISNGRDQEAVTRLVPDNLRGLLRELPSLPSQNAILLGWAAELPTLVKINDLDPAEQPASSDPDFWDVWTYNEKDKGPRKSYWKEISEDWQGGSEEQISVEKPDSPE